jgi:hypothetical protein
MKKITLITLIFFLIIITTITKNSSKNLENEIFNLKENISLLKDKYDLVLLDYNFLSSPKKLNEYRNIYFKDQLISLNINNFKIVDISNKKIKITKFDRLK